MGENKTSYRIRKEQKESLIKLVSRIAGDQPFIVHEKEESTTEITVTIISSSFTPGQSKELESLQDDQVRMKKFEEAGFEVKQVSFDFNAKKK